MLEEKSKNNDASVKNFFVCPFYTGIMSEISDGQQNLFVFARQLDFHKMSNENATPKKNYHKYVFLQKTSDP